MPLAQPLVSSWAGEDLIAKGMSYRMSRTGALGAEEVAHEEGEIGGALGKPAHEIREPLGAKRNVDPHPVAIRDQLAL